MFPAFLNANYAIRKQELDSISKVKTGIALLDQIKARDTIIDSEANEDDFPLYKAFSPNIGPDNELISSSILGVTPDSAKLLYYISKADTCFNSDIDWLITGNLSYGFKNVHAIKKSKEKIKMELSEIDSVLIYPIGINSFGGIIEKISDLKGVSEYLVKIKIKPAFKSRLSDKTYTLIMHMNSKEFSGSVTSSKKYVMIGQMGNEDFEVLKSHFEPIMQIKRFED